MTKVSLNVYFLGRMCIHSHSTRNNIVNSSEIRVKFIYISNWVVNLKDLY